MAITLFGVLGCKSSGGPHPMTDGGTKDVAVDKTTVPDAAADRGCGKTNGTAANGEYCACGGDCASGNCVDGVCCDTPCQGTCQSCGLATSLGTCTFTPAGVEPRESSQCVKGSKETCGLDGTCDGAGKCRNYEPGTVCKVGTCEADAVTGMYTCDGAGACKLGASTVCAPFSCNRSTNACYDACTSDADCVAGRKCVNGSCGKKMNGAVCSKGDECASTFCADIVNGKGVCCNADCGGACRTCSSVAAPGTCMPTPAGQGHPMCAKMAASSCGSTGICDGFGTCSLYPAETPCGPAMCATATTLSTARSCDGLGTCQPAQVQECGQFKCVNGACNSKCTTNADCADGIACVNGSCGPKVDGQPCNANAECQNAHCVKDTATGPGVCCNTDCTGACRSCALASSRGRCTMVAAGAADPRLTCTDAGAASCGTDGKCDGAGACRRYAAGTVCAGESCANDVYSGPSTCNASGQCTKPASQPCFPYHCNASKCFTACTTNAQCVSPNICGMNGMISSCGLKPNGAACSAANECTSNFCAQGVCCNAACTAACKACNLAGSVGSCSNINSGADGRCTTTAASSCGTTGQCSNGACAFHPAGTQCMPASCPTASTRKPPSTCNGSGTCNSPAVTNCAPGRCDTATSTCVNTCTAGAANQCTAPAMCVGGSCGLLPNGGSCTGNNQCQSGQCYLTEGSPGVCCNSACSGTCESCRLTGTVGTCTAVAAGGTDPDPMSACVMAAATSCGLNGRCAGNNTASNAAGTARCQFYGTTTSCRSQSCTAGAAGMPATRTNQAFCNGVGGACPAVTTTSCGNYNKCAADGVSCATSCTTNADCITGVACNTQTHKCGEKLGNGEVCSVAADCTSANCVDGVCCNSACTGACQVCNATPGTCTGVNSMCNDSNACTTDSCSAAGACVNTPVTVPDDGNPCTVDACSPTTGITHNAGNAGAMCRAAMGVCDVASTCDGMSATCPPNAFKPATTMCGPTPGACETQATCTGMAAACPANPKKPAGTVCGPTPTVCQEQAECNGTAVTCPANTNIMGMCRSQSCAPGTGGGAATLTAAASCSAGACPAVSTSSCGNYTKCNGTACATTCATDGDCVAPTICNGGSCTSKSPNGSACTNDNQCTSGNCVGTGNNKVCCNTACTGNCQVCTTGTCTNTASLCPSDNDVCNGTEACGSAGSCVHQNPPTVNDNNPCTADACDPTGGVSHMPTNEGMECGTGNLCCGGMCVAAVDGMCPAGPAPAR